jgi:hypothetical protein
MALKDALSDWVKKTSLGEEQAKLVKRLEEEVKDDDTAGMLNKVLDTLTGK